MVVRRLAGALLAATMLCLGPMGRPVWSAQPAGDAPFCGASVPSIGTAPVLDNPAVAAAVQGLAERIEAARMTAGVAGLSVGVVYDQDVIFEAGFGCADVERGIAASPRTVYRIGSVTKVFEATALMQQRDAGRLRLDDPVDRHVPAVFYQAPDGRRVSPTFRQLASHTSGLPRNVPAGLRTVDQLFQRLERIRALSEPGTTYSYSNLGFVTLGQSVAIIAGLPYHEQIQRDIFTPLGMTSSTFDVGTVDRTRLAVGYTSLERTTQGWTGRAAGYANPFPPSGTILSSVEDMARFVMLQFRDGPAGGSQIVASTSIREMWQPVAPTQGRGAVGLGWHIAPYGTHTMVSKDGGQAGFTSLVRLIPELKLGVVVFVNMSPTLARGPASPAAITRIVLDALVPALSG